VHAKHLKAPKKIKTKKQPTLLVTSNACTEEKKKIKEEGRNNKGRSLSWEAARRVHFWGRGRGQTQKLDRPATVRNSTRKRKPRLQKAELLGFSAEIKSNQWGGEAGKGVSSQRNGGRGGSIILGRLTQVGANLL